MCFQLALANGTKSNWRKATDVARSANPIKTAKEISNRVSVTSGVANLASTLVRGLKFDFTLC